jgi:hypothetical protein
MLTFTQQSFYLVPSIPFFCLSISAFLVVSINHFLHSHETYFKNIRLVSTAFLIIVLGLFLLRQFTKHSINDDKMSDAFLISETVPRGSLISTHPKIFSDWAMVAYTSRLGYVSFDKEKIQTFLLLEKQETPDSLNKSLYNKLDLGLTLYDLYKLKNDVSPQ